MDKMLFDLENYGADIKGAMGRFLDDVELYKSCFSALISDKSFKLLGESLEACDYDKSCEYAHTLKGITGNMGITPLYKLTSSMVDDLRKGEYSHLQQDYDDILAQLNQLESMLN